MAVSVTTTKTPYYSADKDALVKRLHLIRGGVRGIEKMVDDDRSCIDILTQIAAVNTTLESLAYTVLDDHVRHRVAGAVASGAAEDSMAKMEKRLTAGQRFARTR